MFHMTAVGGHGFWPIGKTAPSAAAEEAYLCIAKPVGTSSNSGSRNCRSSGIYSGTPSSGSSNSKSSSTAATAAGPRRPPHMCTLVMSMHHTLKVTAGGQRVSLCAIVADGGLLRRGAVIDWWHGPAQPNCLLLVLPAEEAATTHVFSWLRTMI